MGKNRYIWLDILKILACFFVIINHSYTLLFSATNLSSFSVLFSSAFLAISKSAVPIFIMTSGYLLLRKEVSFKQTCQRIFRVVVPLIIFSLYYFFVVNKESFSILGFVYNFLKEPISTYLWYLYMLPGLYIATPFIIKIVKNSTNSELGLFVGLSLFVPALTNLITAYTGYVFTGKWFLGFFCATWGYFVAGVLLTRIAISRKCFYISVVLYLLSIVGFVLSIFITYINKGVFECKLDSWQALPVVISSLSLYYIFRYLFENREFKKSKRIVSEISLTTFGIYLIHHIALDKISHLIISQSILDINAYIGVLSVQVSCFIGCSIVILLCRKIPILKNFL